MPVMNKFFNFIAIMFDAAKKGLYCENYMNLRLNLIHNTIIKKQ